jgi:hypothetical protein
MVINDTASFAGNGFPFDRTDVEPRLEAPRLFAQIVEDDPGDIYGRGLFPRPSPSATKPSGQGRCRARLRNLWKVASASP